jgi:hypothetical protein
VSRERDFRHPEQEDIERIIKTLDDVRDMLIQFIDRDFQRLVHPDFRDDVVAVKDDFKSIIKQKIFNAQGYLEVHRYDPEINDKVRNADLSGVQGERKTNFLRKIKDKFFQVLADPWTDIARKFVNVTFDTIDTYLKSASGFLPGLEAITEIKEYMKHAINASETLSLRDDRRQHDKGGTTDTGDEDTRKSSDNKPSKGS